MMNEEDTLLYNYLNSFLQKENAQIELLVGNNGCTQFDSETKRVEGKIKNLNFFLDFFSNKKILPKVVLNFGSKKLASEWVERLAAYQGNKSIVTKSRDFNFSSYPEVNFNIINNHSDSQLKFGKNIKNIISLDFDRNLQEIKEIFEEAYKNEGRVELNQRKKLSYTEEEFTWLNQFIYFLVKFIYDEAGQNKEKYKELINKSTGFNFFPGFGRGCPANHKIFVSLEDLSIVFCPNLTTEEYSYGKIKENGEVKAKNNELLITILKTGLKDMPVCETCILNEICDFDCFLSQRKKSGDFFVPHPEFCRYSHKKTLFFLKAQQKFELNNPRENKILNKLKVN